MKDKLCVVTGANSGIGLYTALGLAQQGAHVVMTARDPQKGATAQGWVQQRVPSAKLDLLIADFASLEDVRLLAATINERYQRLDVLINNAGLFSPRWTASKDNIEMTLAVNHLAPFLLTSLLLDKLKHSAPSRIVTLASTAHWTGTIDFDDLEGRKHYTMWRAYRQSKLANILFTRELARRLRGTGVTANCVHPGIVATNIASRSLLLKTFWTLFSPFMKSARQGAATSLYAATSPEAANVSGAYFADCAPAPSSARSHDMGLAARLWAASETLISSSRCKTGSMHGSRLSPE